MQMHVHTQHTHMQAHTIHLVHTWHMDIHTNKRIHTYTHTYMYACTRTHARTHMHAHTCTHTHARTHTHTCTHKHAHTHIVTLMYTQHMNISNHTINSSKYSSLTLISPAALRGPRPATNWTQANRWGCSIAKLRSIPTSLIRAMNSVWMAAYRFSFGIAFWNSKKQIPQKLNQAHLILQWSSHNSL